LLPPLLPVVLVVEVVAASEEERLFRLLGVLVLLEVIFSEGRSQPIGARATKSRT
jgi:hypothetical protein